LRVDALTPEAEESISFNLSFKSWEVISCGFTIPKLGKNEDEKIFKTAWLE